MKRHLLLLAMGLSAAWTVLGQCPANYTQARLDWDKMGFISTVGYATGYLSTTMCTNQNFAFGAIQLNIKHNYPVTATDSPNDNNNHTGDVGGYGWGEDVEFVGDGKITLTFSAAVYNVKFSLYDIEKGQKASVTAFNGATPVSLSMTACAATGSILTIANASSTNPTATALNGNGQTGAADNKTNVGSLNIDVAGPVTQIVIDISQSTGGKNNTDDIYLSDIAACAPGTFPSNYQQTGTNRPFTGQPDYILATPDNNSVYMVDPATGKAWHLFTEPNTKFINSFAYDPYNKILYYVLDGSTNPASNKKIRKYDFNTETASDFITDVTAYGIPTFEGGVESAGASYYDGALYLGIEGGAQKESLVWRININNGVPAPTAYEVYGVPVSGHDWGDFSVKNGTLYDFNTSTGGSSQFKHFNLMTDSLVNYSTPSVGQAALTWAGNLYSVRDVVEKYNEDGTKGPAQTITVVKGPVWVNNAGDAAGPFKPKADFGDAPDSYDPVALSPAVHEMDTTLRIGAKLDREWSKVSSGNAEGDGDDEDGLISGRILNLANGNYMVRVNVYNHTGADATVAAWVDFNANGTFEAGEGMTKTIASSTSLQTVDLYWSGIAQNLPDNSFTYLRVRTTSASNLMTVSNPTGYYNNGEVEDYYLSVNTTPLEIKDVAFEAARKNTEVQAAWTITGDEKDVLRYRVQRSANGSNWSVIGEVGVESKTAYVFHDLQPLGGVSYYRLEILLDNGRKLYSGVKKVVFDAGGVRLKVLSNPSVSVIQIEVQAYKEQKASLDLLNASGSRIASLSRTLNKGTTYLSIPVDHLPAGPYYLQIRTEGYTDQKKIVVVK